MQEKKNIEKKSKFRFITGFFKWSFRLALAVVLLVATAIFMMFPKESGTVELKNTALKSAVTIKRDEFGIPHIEAQNDNDAAFALGFTHAQDRLWQLEFNRRVMKGELSEILGEQTLATDKFIRTLGVLKAAKAQYAGLNEENKRHLESYVAGINAYIDTKPLVLPTEFLLTGAKPLHWTPELTLAWGIMMALDLGGNYNNELFRMSLARDFDVKQIWEILPNYNHEKPVETADFVKLYRDLGVYKKQTAEAPHQAPFLHGVEGIGSNNWVVSGALTKSGKPMLSNDPHLGLSAPAIWYFAHIKTPTQNVTGATFAGASTVILGRNEKIAWGFTNTGPDVQDLYLEMINPANPKEYKTPNGFQAFVERQETIKVKGKPDIALTIKETRNGAVMTDVLAGGSDFMDTSKFQLSMRWTALDSDNSSLVAARKLNKAGDIYEAMESLRGFLAPQQSIVIADEANIAMIAAGRVPLRHSDNDLKGLVPALGWEDKYQWQGVIPFEELPRSINPPKGYIATANQRIVDANYKHQITYDWTSPYRYNRIETLLDKGGKHDAASFKTILGDVTSLAAEKLNPSLQNAAKFSKHPLAEKARGVLGNFTGVMVENSAAPLIFSSFADQFAQLAFVSKLGARKSVYGSRDFRPALEAAIERNDTLWCNGSCEVMALQAFDKALDDLTARYGSDVDKWQWGTAHAALSEHRPLGKVKQLAPYFNVSVPTSGDTYTVNVGRLSLGNRAAPFNNIHAASLRAIYDLSDLEKSEFIYQTGQNGNVFSQHYKDYAEKWRKLEFNPLKLNVTATTTLTLKP